MHLDLDNVIQMPYFEETSSPRTPPRSPLLTSLPNESKNRRNSFSSVLLSPCKVQLPQGFSINHLDIRHKVLARFLEELEKEHLHELKDPSITVITRESLRLIKNLMKEGYIGKFQLKAIGDLIKQSFQKLLYPAYAKYVIQLIESHSSKVNDNSRGNDNEVIQCTILSVGCGGGHIEENLDTYIKREFEKTGKTINIKWIGTDLVIPNSNAFFSLEKGNFEVINYDKLESFWDIVRKNQGSDESVEDIKIILCNLCVHHMNMKFYKFLSYGTGADYVVLLEEPVGVEWNLNPINKWMRIAYDLIANISLNPNWAETWMDHPCNFYVDYIDDDVIKRFRGTCLDIEGVFPRTSLVTFPVAVKPSETQSVYSLYAKEYVDVVENNFWNAHYERPALRSMMSNLSGKRVLDAGCAGGSNTEWFLSQNAETFAIDISESMVQITKERLAKLGDKVAESRVFQADIGSPLSMFPDEFFDVIVCSLSIHYIQDWGTTFQEFNRILKPKGEFIFSTFHPSEVWQASRSEDYFQQQLIRDTWVGITDEPLDVCYYVRPLSFMFTALSSNGFLVQNLNEAMPTPESREFFPELYEMFSKKPWFVILKSLKY